MIAEEFFGKEGVFFFSLSLDEWKSSLILSLNLFLRYMMIIIHIGMISLIRG